MIREEWQSDDGAIRLILGDCLEILPTLEAGSVDAVVTDPPYPEDDRFESSFELVHGMAVASFDACAEKALLFSDCFRPGLPTWIESLKPWEYYDLICGFVVNSMANCAFGVDRFCPAVVARKGGCTARERYTNVIQITRTAKQPKHKHPSMKNLALLTSYVRMAAKASMLICDPFTGSGTTGVACIRTGRRFIGIEINPEYYEIAKRRCIEELNRYPLLEPPRAKQRSFLESSE
jgi:DNA modification methylase